MIKTKRWKDKNTKPNRYSKYVFSFLFSTTPEQSAFPGVFWDTQYHSTGDNWFGRRNFIGTYIASGWDDWIFHSFPPSTQFFFFFSLQKFRNKTPDPNMEGCISEVCWYYWTEPFLFKPPGALNCNTLTVSSILGTRKLHSGPCLSLFISCHLA